MNILLTILGWIATILMFICMGVVMVFVLLLSIFGPIAGAIFYAILYFFGMLLSLFDWIKKKFNNN